MAAVTEADVRRIATSMPEVVERTSYGTPAWFVTGRLFARVHDSGTSIVVRVVDEGDKRALVAEDPTTFWTTPHYDGYASVLVRLDAVDGARLTELLRDAWRVRAKATALRAHPEV